MVATHSWHPGTHNVNPRWEVLVPLLPDELFSSWLVRAALVQGCDPLVLTGSIWPDWRAWMVDPDRGDYTNKLHPLSLLSGIGPEAFEAAMLHSVALTVQGSDVYRKPVWPWMLARGSRNRRKQAGLQYCPACLAGDKVPYYRLHWRFAWHTVCHLHQALLLDCCLHCGKPIEPHRLTASDGHIAKCASCKSDLSIGTGAEISANALSFQQTADQVVREKEGPYGSTILPANEWFAVSRYLLVLLRRALRGRPRGLWATLSNGLSVDMVTLATPATGLPFELLPVHERAALLTGVWSMLESGPQGFLIAAKSGSLTASSLNDKKLPIPSCIGGLLSELPDKCVTNHKRAEAGRSTAPSSKQSVMHMWARLQRKLRSL